MRRMKKPEEFQAVIAYEFQNLKLLKQALTHSSYANEKRMENADNERLEFLGDAVLEIITSEFLFLTYPDLSEGDLTKFRASLVCEPTLSGCAAELGIGDFLHLGKGEELTGGRGRKSILSDALEAVIGAIYLDGGFTSAKEFVRNFILTDVEHKKLFYDSKTILQEYVQGNGMEALSYHMVHESGPDHSKSFTVEAKIGDKTVSSGSGATKKAAEQEAAYRALLLLNPKLGQGETCI